MSLRSIIAVLLLINYLLVVGAGCVNRPEDQHELLLVQTLDDEQHFQQCRYLRMDGLETFLAEALANRYKPDSQTAQHHLYVVVNGVDAHHLPTVTWLLSAPAYRIPSLAVAYQAAITADVSRELYTPPWLG